MKAKTKIKEQKKPELSEKEKAEHDKIHHLKKTSDDQVKQHIASMKAREKSEKTD